MRPRHWKQVLRCAMPASPSSPSLVGRAGALNIPALEQLTLGELMAMQLHGVCACLEGVCTYVCTVCTKLLHTQVQLT